MYFILSCIWLMCGVGVLAYQLLSGDQRLTMHILGAPISVGWIMLVLSGYNFLRWWSRRPSLPLPQTSQLLSRRHRVRRMDEPTERDPNFIFTDEPPPRRDPRMRRLDEPTERDPNFIFTDEPPPPRDLPPSEN